MIATSAMMPVSPQDRARAILKLKAMGLGPDGKVSLDEEQRERIMATTERVLEALGQPPVVGRYTDAQLLKRREENKAVARKRLIAACAYLDPNYRTSFHHRVIADAFERFVKGNCAQVMILCAPPGTGKSDIVSRKGPAWAIGNDPSLFFANACYSGELGGDMAQDCFNLAVSDEFKELFPDAGVGRAITEEGKVSSTAKHWRTGRGGGYKGLGRKGGITGKHPNRFILDDLFKDDEEAQSPTIRAKVWEFFLKVVLQRMGAHGKILIMNTRWHRDDLVGRLEALKKEHPDAVDYEIINLPARMEDTAKRYPGDNRELGDPLWPWMWAGGKPGTPRYKKGEAPEGHPDYLTRAQQVEKAKAHLKTWEATDPAGFSSQGQQVPAPKSAYGAHAYSKYGTHNWVESYIPLLTRPIIVGMDFNYNPMSSILAQETTLGQLFPLKYRGTPYEQRRAFVIFRSNGFKNCTTRAACEQIIEQMGPGYTYIIYPDNAANSRTPHGEGGPTDLAIIEAEFKKNGKFWTRLKGYNPRRKSRLDAVNAALSCEGKRLPAEAGAPEGAKPRYEFEPPVVYVVKNQCENLIRDFNECGREEFLNDQYSDPTLGHAGDSMGYWIDHDMPVTPGYKMFTKR